MKANTSLTYRKRVQKAQEAFFRGTFAKLHTFRNIQRAKYFLFRPESTSMMTISSAKLFVLSEKGWVHQELHSEQIKCKWIFFFPYQNGLFFQHSIFLHFPPLFILDENICNVYVLASDSYSNLKNKISQLPDLNLSLIVFFCSIIAITPDSCLCVLSLPEWKRLET